MESEIDRQMRINQEVNKAKNILTRMHNALQAVASIAECVKHAPEDTALEEADQLAALVEIVAKESSELLWVRSLLKK